MILETGKSIAELKAAGDRVVAMIAQLPPRPELHKTLPSPIGMTAHEYLAMLHANDKPTHACGGCGWKGNVSGDAGGCPACGGVVTPQV